MAAKYIYEVMSIPIDLEDIAFYQFDRYTYTYRGGDRTDIRIRLNRRQDPDQAATYVLRTVQEYQGKELGHYRQAQGPYRDESAYIGAYAGNDRAIGLAPLKGSPDYVAGGQFRYEQGLARSTGLLSTAAAIPQILVGALAGTFGGFAVAGKGVDNGAAGLTQLFTGEFQTTSTARFGTNVALAFGASDARAKAIGQDADFLANTASGLYMLKTVFPGPDVLESAGALTPEGSSGAAYLTSSQRVARYEAVLQRALANGRTGEAIGELGTRVEMMRRGYLLVGEGIYNNSNNGIDAVYQHVSSGEIAVVESKFRAAFGPNNNPETLLGCTF